MRYSIKAVIIISVVAVISFFVAQEVIPDKKAPGEKKTAEKTAKKPAQPVKEPAQPAKEDAQPTAADSAPSGPAEDIQVVSIDAAAPQTKPAAEPETAARQDTAKKPAPAVVVDAKKPAEPPQKTAPAVVDTKKPAEPTQKTAPAVVDAKKAAEPPQKTATAAVDAKKTAVPDAKKDTAKSAAATPPQPRQKPAAQTHPAGQPYKLEKAALCAAIENKGPQGITDKFAKGTTQVYYFTHVTGARDTAATIIHRWYHQGSLVQTSILPVRSPNWRTHSKRNLFKSHEPAGQWKVEVVEPKSGKVLETATFVVE